ncbi:hypothetical protein CGCTS75_v004580 [Colletotrichum tropicale]|nr:hypothetical protein CGCTS75_v004580 [Colletotrichum tropicale]
MRIFGPLPPVTRGQHAAQCHVSSTHPSTLTLLTRLHTDSNKCRPLRQELDILYQHKESPPTVRAAVDRQLARWLVDNDEKARMMVYHAAKLLCCLRDHPTNSHHEPMALLTACLALWMFTALGKHTLPPTQSSSLLGSDPRPSRLSMAATLRFDKKIEEDMITLWKMGNADLRPFINGIGSLFETGWSLSIAVGMVLRAQYKHNRRVK